MTKPQHYLVTAFIFYEAGTVPWTRLEQSMLQIYDGAFTRGVTIVQQFEPRMRTSSLRLGLVPETTPNLQALCLST